MNRSEGRRLQCRGWLRWKQATLRLEGIKKAGMLTFNYIFNNNVSLEN